MVRKIHPSNTEKSNPAAVWTFFVLMASATAQEQSVNLGPLLDAGRDWLKENVDERFLESFEKTGQQELDRVLQNLQKEFHGDYVLDLGALRRTASSAVP